MILSAHYVRKAPLKPLDAAVFQVVERSDNLQAGFLLFLDFKAAFDDFQAVADVELAGLHLVFLVADGLRYLVRDEFDVALGVVVDCGVYRAAMVVAQHYDQVAAQVAGRVFDAAELMFIDDVAGNSDDEQIAQAHIEDGLGHHA